MSTVLLCSKKYHWSLTKSYANAPLNTPDRFLHESPVETVFYCDSYRLVTFLGSIKSSVVHYSLWLLPLIYRALPGEGGDESRSKGFDFSELPPHKKSYSSVVVSADKGKVISLVGGIRFAK